MNDLNSRIDEGTRAINELNSQKARLQNENTDLNRQLEDAESRIGSLTKERQSLLAQLDDAKKSVEDETRVRQKCQSEIRNLSADLDNLREQLEEEQEAKSDVQRQLSKANAEVQQWRIKFESEGTARADELEEARRRLQCKLTEAEEAVDAANGKVSSLEKTKSRLTGELEDLMVDVERVRYTSIVNLCVLLSSFPRSNIPDFNTTE